MPVSIRLACLTAALAVPVAAAQGGTVRYDHTVALPHELPALPESAGALTHGTRQRLLLVRVLTFDASAPLMKADLARQDSIDAASPVATTAWICTLDAGRGFETVFAAHVRIEDGAFAESRRFRDNVFRVTGTRMARAGRPWGERKEFLGYEVMQATATADTQGFEAWFAPDIPERAGPGLFGGLPGLILLLFSTTTSKRTPRWTCASTRPRR